MFKADVCFLPSLPPGLRTQGWELAVRDKSAPELRLEYALLKMKAREERARQQLQPESECSAGIDLTDLFDRYLQASLAFFLPLPKSFDTVNKIKYIGQIQRM